MSVAGNLGRQTFPVPIGSVLFYASSQSKPTPPTYLVCDGRAFDPVKYPLLADALGGSNTPDLRQKIIGGGPLVDVGQIVPAVTGSATASSILLTKQNIPTVPFDVSVGSISTVVTLNSGGQFLANPLTSQVTQASGNDVSVSNPTTVADATFNLPDTATFDNTGQTQITPTINLAGGTNPTSLVLRYIIKAEY